MVPRWTIGVLLMAAAAAGCGSSSSSSESRASSSSTRSTSSTSDPYAQRSVQPVPAGVDPSPEALMICSDTAQQLIAESLSVGPNRVTSPTWADHVYACDYVYDEGVVKLSVKELSSVEETTAYFEHLAQTLGRGMTFNLGEGAFHTDNGSLVVRKDYKVLLVDVADAPTQFGKFRLPANSVAFNVGETIMGCWVGA